MQADQKPVIWTVVIATFVLLVAGIIGSSVINTNLKLAADALDDINVDVDEQGIVNAIMAGIVIPEVVVPEWTAPEMPDTAKLNEVWDEIYSKEVEELEADAEEVFGEQFLDDNERGVGQWFIKEDEFDEDSEIYELVTEGVECDEDCIVEFVKEYKDDYEITIFNLGLDDEDDREVIVSARIRVKVFTDEDDLDEYFFEKVDINSAVTSDDGVLEAEVTYSL